MVLFHYYYLCKSSIPEAKYESRVHFFNLLYGCWALCNQLYHLRYYTKSEIFSYQKRGFMKNLSKFYKLSYKEFKVSHNDYHKILTEVVI